jgi:anti-sigma-K factor RskA
VKEYEAELATRQAALEKFTLAKHDEMVTALRSREQVARYLLAAQQGAGPQPLPEFEINDGKSLVPFITKRWADFLTSAAERNDDVFAVWRRFIAIPTSEFAAKAPAVAQEIARTPSINPLVARFVATGANGVAAGRPSRCRTSPSVTRRC